MSAAAGNTLHHGWVVDRAGQRLDEVVAAVFRAPRSYTCEDVVELSCHGGRMSADRVLRALLEAGARLAGPGEFTLRAFLNGRLDLSAAEAVADVIRAETEQALIAEFKHSVGEHNEIRIEFVDAIPQEKSGKFRFAISKVANPFA